MAWPQEKGCKKNPMRPCDANGKPPNRTFPEFKLINREERGERCLWGWCTPKCSRMQCVTLQPREWHPTKLSSVVHEERRACEQGGHGTDSPQTFQEPTPPATSQSPPRHDVACSWCFDDNRRCSGPNLETGECENDSFLQTPRQR